MSVNNLTERLYVSASSAGLGEKRGRGQGSVGIQKIDVNSDKRVELSIGRDSKGWNKHWLATAWARLTSQQAHELAMALLYMTNSEIPCAGEGITTKHKMNMSISISFEADLCTLLTKGEDVKKEVLAMVANRLDTMQLPGKKETLNAGQ